jgi:threonine dehydratase
MLYLHFTNEERGCWNRGNHAQALSAKLLSMQATITMPKGASHIKVDATKGYGGNAIFYDPCTGDRNAIANDKQAKMNASLILDSAL